MENKKVIGLIFGVVMIASISWGVVIKVRHAENVPIPSDEVRTAPASISKNLVQSAPLSNGKNIVELRILDEDGKPIPGINVKLFTVYTASTTIRFPLLSKVSDDQGNIRVSLEEFIDKTGVPSPQNQFGLFLVAYGEGYLNRYIFDQNGEPKKWLGETWRPEIVLHKQPSDQLVIKDGQYSVYYWPGQENCAKPALKKLVEDYPKLVNILGFEHPRPTLLRIIFNQFSDKAHSGDAGSVIEMACYPWYDEVDAEWLFVVTHELAHLYVSYTPMPKWADEGFAEYMENLINGQLTTCDSSKFLPVQDTNSVVYYATDACFWSMLSNRFDGVVKSSVAKLYELNTSSLGARTLMTRDFLEKVILPVISHNFSTETEARKYISELMVNFKYDPAKP